MDNWIKEHIDFKTIVITLLLLFIGAVSIYSATYDAGVSSVYYRQMAWLGIGIVLMISVAFSSFRTIQLLSYPLYFISILSLIAVYYLGKSISGSTSWFGIGGFGLQPSEFAKVSVILALASFLSHRFVNLQRLKDVVIASGIVAIPSLLVVLQPDLGTALIYLGILLGVLYWAGISMIFIIIVLAPMAAALAGLYGITAFLIVLLLTAIVLLLLKENRFISALVFSLTAGVGASVQFIFSKLAPYQQKRILTFINPEIDPLGASYNVIQSKIAIGSGGIIGKGYLQGTQTQLNFIPAQWTDFIFCVPSEEFGFIGASIILILFYIFLYRGIKLAETVKSRYASIVVIGIISTFLTHITINIGMSMGIFPVIGVPLPFLSYGGSHIITNLIMVGLLLNMYANRKEY